MTSTQVWIVIVGMAVTNIVMRGAPMAVLSRLRLPAVVQRWLGYVPVSVMAAIVALAVLRPDGRWLALTANPYLLAAIPTALVFRFTRSFLGATAAGIVSFLLLRGLLG